jgi:uncharacterized protein DUF6496
LHFSREEVKSMPEQETIERAREDEREGKSPSTQAGEFVHEEIEHVREGKHGARSTKQAIAIGLSKARRAGVKLPPPEKGKASAATRRKAAQDVKKGQAKKGSAKTAAAKKGTSRTRSRATSAALKREGRSAASRTALSRQAKSAAKKRTAADRSAAARKGAKTKGPAKRSAAARKAARTRARRTS